MSDRATICPKRVGMPCETPMACAGGCRYADDPVHPNRVEEGTAPALQTTAEAKAIRLLEARGYIVSKPPPRIRMPLVDQCEYPDRRGQPGDTCTHDAMRNRKTSQGTMWLCSSHVAQPEAELFDERLAP